MDGARIARIGVGIATALVLAAVALVFTMGSGQSGLPRDWLPAVRAGETFALTDPGARTFLGMRHGALFFEQRPRGLVLVLGMPMVVALFGLAAFFGHGAWTSRRGDQTGTWALTTFLVALAIALASAFTNGTAARSRPTR